MVAPRPAPRLRGVGWALGAGGAALSVPAALWDPHRFAAAWLWGFAFAWVIAVGALFFVALQHLTNATWSVVVRRVAEAVAWTTWVVVVLAVPVALFIVQPEVFHLFPGLDPGHVAADPVLQAKSAYLNSPFLLARFVGSLLVWWLFARYFVRRSLAQDRGVGATEEALRMKRAAAPFLLLFAVTVTLASVDLLMGLNPHWYSTVFGIYVFSGMFVAALAALTLAVLLLRWRGVLDDAMVHEDHLYNLGALMFAMSCFWAYIAYSQWMLIWVAHLPEETVFYVKRLDGRWTGLTVALPLLRFVVPFLALLSRRAKKNPRVLGIVAALVLVGEALDLYWLVMPEVHPGGPRLGWQEVGPFALACGLLCIAFERFLARHPALATGDPRFEMSARFRL